MITIVTGPPGNGKSLLEQSVTVEEWLFGCRDIVTSTPVRILPWVTGDGRIMMGLKAYCQNVLRKEFPDPVVIRPGIVAAGRLLVVEDEEELGSLFMWRRDRNTGEWFKVRWDLETEQFNREDLARIGAAGQFIITDEAWKCYSSRRWKDSEKVTEFYGRQHRKFGDDWHLVSHSHKDLDVQINRMAQQWQICTNFGLRRIGIFRQPSVFQVRTFYEPPSSVSARPFHTVVRRLDVRVAQTYDTSAGVAVGGGRGADVKRRRKGLSLVWLFIAVGVGLVFLLMLPRILRGGFNRYLRSGLGLQASNGKQGVSPGGSAVRVSATNEMVVATNQPVSAAHGAGGEPVSDVASGEKVQLAGWFLNDNKLRVLYSDGRMERVTRELRRVPGGRWRVDGVEYEMAKPSAVSWYGAAVPSPQSVPLYMPATETEPRGSSVSVTAFGSRSESRPAGAGRARFFGQER